MRTLGAMRPEKQYKIAGETLYIYAPLAHRLGLFKIKLELEDLAFKYEHPTQYAEIMEKLSETADHREKIVEEFVRPVRKMLDDAGFKYEIKARVKSAYSIFNKMQTKKIPFEEIYDIYAVRVILRMTTMPWRRFAAGRYTHSSPTDIVCIPTDYATGQASRKPTDTVRFTSRQWDRRGNGLRCRYVPGKWMRLPNSDMPHIGNTRPECRKTTANLIHG